MTGFFEEIGEDLLALEVLFEKDFWPYIKQALMMFKTEEGAVILRAAIEAVGGLTTVGFAATVQTIAEKAIAAAPAIAAQDITWTLNQIQTALQLVKNSAEATTFGDAASLHSIQAVVLAVPHAEPVTPVEAPLEEQPEEHADENPDATESAGTDVEPEPGEAALEAPAVEEAPADDAHAVPAI